MELNRRIEVIMAESGMSRATFCEALNISQGTLSLVFSGRNQPSLDLVTKLLKTFPHVNPDWLILGTGNPKREENSALNLDKLHQVILEIKMSNKLNYNAIDSKSDELINALNTLKRQ